MLVVVEGDPATASRGWEQAPGLVVADRVHPDTSPTPSPLIPPPATLGVITLRVIARNVTGGSRETDRMPIDFTFSADVDEARERIGAFIEDEVETTTKRLVDEQADPHEWRTPLPALR